MASAQAKQNKPALDAGQPGLSGRAPLVSGAFLKSDMQLLASKNILETVTRLMLARQVQEGYHAVLSMLAGRINEKRRVEETFRPEETNPEIVITPATPRDALMIALMRNDLDAEIVDERHRGEKSIYIIEVEGRRLLVPLNSSVMEGDAVRNVEKVLSAISLERERGPSASMLGVDDDALSGRRVKFGGEMGGYWLFEYSPDNTEATFTIPYEFRGEELLGYLDARIIELHERFGKPLIGQVLEKQAEADGIEVQGAGSPEEKRIARVLHRLLAEDFPGEMIPREYVRALTELRCSEEYLAWKHMSSEGIFSEDEVQRFRDAYEELDHPANVVAKLLHKHYIGADGKLTPEGQQVIRETLVMGSLDKVALPEPVLRNLAAAYSLVSGDEGACGWTEDALRKSHLMIMRSLRDGIADMTSSGFDIPIFKQE